MFEEKDVNEFILLILQAMTEIGDEDAPPDSWDRHFYEGSLSAAANMLHVNGNSDEQGQTQTHYEIYKDE